MFKFFKILTASLIIFLSYYSINFANTEKIKIGVLVPMTGEHKNLGLLIIKSTKIALEDIGVDNIEIYPKNTFSDPNQTLQSAMELKNKGVKIIIGPIFSKNLIYLDEVKDVVFLSLTNKTINLPNNTISAGINSLSQLNAIKKFIELNEIEKTIILTPDLNYQNEINQTIKQSKINFSKHYIYNTEPTKLTEQIEKITNYKIRKQNLEDEIKRLEQSDDLNKERKIKQLEKRYTLGKVNFNSVVIADFDESLKSVTTSLLYTDVSPKM